MCGIAGYYGQGNKDLLVKMTNALKHRGPDDAGFFVDEKVGLGHQRLSIIDLSSAAHQPMSNEDKTIWIAFNGEIYNFKELRSKLKNKHTFTSSSDTEIILHLYEEMGVTALEQLEGMFAIALYDQKNKKLFLARDRMGKKPIYYSLVNNTLIFGSEIKALLNHSLIKKELNLSALNEYLLYEYVPTPNSIFKNIYKLEPGHFLEYDGDNLKKQKFWEINFQLSITNYQLRIIDAIKELDTRIDRAVQTRLVSDVPLGIFLSGGIDSSTIAYYAQKNSHQKIKTFSIGFKEDSFDESKYARLVARHLGTEHYEKILSAEDSLNLIPRIGELMDEPLADASIVPTFLLSKFTREHVTVALGGDGGDELFCGYDTFVAHRLAEYYEKIPRAIRQNLIEEVVKRLPTSFSNISFDFKAKKFISGFNIAKKYRHQHWLGAFDRDERKKLFQPDVWQQIEKENEFKAIDDYLVNVAQADYFNQLIYLYLRTYLMDDILVKVDRASMFNSLEVRAPFLDTAVVDFANSLPLPFKLHRLSTKYILKKLMAGKLPPSIINRKKKGFGLPIAQWIAGDLKSFTLEMLNENKIKKEGLFDYQYISKLLNDHFNRRADNRKLIWTLLIFQMWREKWLR